jgi:hypothetical protein
MMVGFFRLTVGGLCHLKVGPVVQISLTSILIHLYANNGASLIRIDILLQPGCWLLIAEPVLRE